MTLNISNNLTLQTARSSLLEGANRQANNIAQAAENIQGALSSAQNALNEVVGDNLTLQPTGAGLSPVPQDIPSPVGLGADRVTLSPEAEVAQRVVAQNEESLVSNIVDLQTASTAFIANLRALETVNDLERETVDILR